MPGFIKKRKFSFNISTRIYLSFLLFVLLFVLNGFVVMSTVFKTRGKALHIATVIDPSLQKLDAFRDLIVHSKMYTTNWVFMGSRQSDKDSLLVIHSTRYKQLKSDLSQLSSQWLSKENTDSLRLLFAGFERSVSAQKRVADLLHKPDDYGNFLRRKEAERIVQEEIIPQTDAIAGTLSFIIAKEQTIKAGEEHILEESFKKMWVFILGLLLNIIFLGFILSRYLTKIIIGPINKIRFIIGNLANGITGFIPPSKREDEIGKMVRAVNALSARLEYTAFFSKSVGNRNYDVPFEPLSDEDTLGRSLVAMRDNMKSLDESLNHAQHLARIGNWEWDFRTDKITWSDELYIIFGKKRTEFTPAFDTVIQYIHEDDKDAVLALFDGCLRNCEAFSLECRFVIDGITKHIFAQINVIVDENNLLHKLFGIMQDVTERVQKEQEVKKFNERFQRLSDATNDLFWDWDLITNEIWWNKNYFEAFSFDPKKGVPSLNDWSARLHPHDREKALKRLKSIKSSGIESWDDELRYLRSNGEWGNAQDRAYILRDERGRVVRMIGAIQDITARKKAEQEIANSERRYRQIVETAQEGIWLIDENDRTVFVNKKMCEMLGFTPEEMLGMVVYDLIDESERKRVSEQIERRKAGMTEYHELIFRSKNGQRVWAYLSTNPVLDENGVYKGALAMVTDITQRKQQDELLKKHEASLQLKNEELLQKNRELEQFAYIASHDLQEPLRTVSSFSSQLQKQYNDQLDDLAKKYLFFIHQGTERMKALITDLLDYSRIGNKKELKTIDCNELVENVIADLHMAIHESSVQIRMQKLPVVNGYTTEMKQLFQNLISNAIKFRRKEVLPQIFISSQSIKGGWEFRIEDNGIGIAEEHSERIFVIFQRLHTRSEYEGTGIGLSHCKKIVELHGGKIWVRSKPGEGSTFHFTILENNN